jgi:hypothetical protein
LLPLITQPLPDAKESVNRMLKPDVVPPPPLTIFPAGQVTDARPCPPGGTETAVPETEDSDRAGAAGLATVAVDPEAAVKGPTRSAPPATIPAATVSLTCCTCFSFTTLEASDSAMSLTDLAFSCKTSEFRSYSCMNSILCPPVNDHERQRVTGTFGLPAEFARLGKDFLAPLPQCRQDVFASHRMSRTWPVWLSIPPICRLSLRP